MVMTGVSGVRAGISAKMIAGAAIVAAVFTVGGTNPSYAQTGAPIVYKTASPAYAPTVRLEKSAEGMALNVLPHAPVPTFANSPIASASFGPALPTPNARTEAPRPLVSAPSAFAQPYAGPPYQVAGKWYVPTYEPNYDEIGIASWYGPTFHGKDSASGEVFDEMAMTAAHPTLPIPSLVRVTNLENGKTVIVRLNDRGPFVDDRIIDLSKAAGAVLDLHGKGTAKVRVQYVGPAPAEANAAPVQYQPVAQPVAQKQLIVDVKPLAPIAIPVVAKPAPLVQPVQTRGFFLQAGSFADLGNANALRDKLRGKAPVSITAAQVNGTEFYRVMAGPWPSREEAEMAQGRLGQSSIVVSRLD